MAVWNADMTNKQTMFSLCSQIGKQYLKRLQKTCAMWHH